MNKIQIDNKYGYKVCYQENSRGKLHIHLVTNSYQLAIWEIELYSIYPQLDRHNHRLIRNPTWHLFEVKTKKEYKKLWKGCPF